MLERVPTVLTAQEILDKAFARAAKLEVPDPVKYHRVRKTMERRIESATSVIADTFDNYIRRFPSLDNLRDYERELLDLLVGLDKIHKALASLKWARDRTRDIGLGSLDKMRRVRHTQGFMDAQGAVYGRISSIVNQVDGSLTLLRELRDRAKVLPTIDPGYPTMVIAGYPNVGKSSLLAAWTNARPEIAGYAFTTKTSNVGHFETTDSQGDPVRIQVVDTPGLLDRPDEQRNIVERHAAAALRHAADAVLFLVDPTMSSGYSLEDQEKLLAQVESDMAGLPIVVAETKADLVQPDMILVEGRVRFSVKTGEGLEDLRQAMIDVLPTEEEVTLEEDPLEKWMEKRAGEQRQI